MAEKVAEEVQPAEPAEVLARAAIGVARKKTKRDPCRHAEKVTDATPLATFPPTTTTTTTAAAEEPTLPLPLP